jgi:hypothetical protein
MPLTPLSLAFVKQANSQGAGWFTVAKNEHPVS